jgi:hypothetical protein
MIMHLIAFAQALLDVWVDAHSVYRVVVIRSEWPSFGSRQYKYR